MPASVRTFIGMWTRIIFYYPRRFIAKRNLLRKYAFCQTELPIRPSLVAGVIRTKNEDYWIELILRTTCKTLEDVVVIDTGSTDKTISIIGRMQEEGLPVRLFQHHEQPSVFNLFTNLVLERAIGSEYYYLIDGDEIQLHPSLVLFTKQLASMEREKVWRIAHHHLFVHPDDFHMCTDFCCRQVRYQAGRVFKRKRLRMSEIMVNDGTERITGLPFLRQDSSSIFMKDVFTLHCPLSQRSTIKKWGGNAEINPEYAGKYRIKRYLADADYYIPLPFFPKEILECKYSDHNHYIPSILEKKVPLI